MEKECIFCKIIHGEIPAQKIYEDTEVMAFQDLNPQAPHHFLVIPKKHITGPSDISDADEPLIGKVMRTGAQVARQNGLDDFRFVINNGAEAGQTVFHLHLHVLGGRAMSWPPG